jgi:protein RecA
VPRGGSSRSSGRVLGRQPCTTSSPRQARGGVCAFVDAEHAIDPIYAKRIGVNTDELLVSQPDYGEQALEIVDVLVRSGAVDVVAVDSVAALTPRVELEGQMGTPRGPPRRG